MTLSHDCTNTYEKAKCVVSLSQHCLTREGNNTDNYLGLTHGDHGGDTILYSHNLHGCDVRRIIIIGC